MLLPPSCWVRKSLAVHHPEELGALAVFCSPAGNNVRAAWRGTWMAVGRAVTRPIIDQTPRASFSRHCLTNRQRGCQARRLIPNRLTRPKTPWSATLNQKSALGTPAPCNLGRIPRNYAARRRLATQASICVPHVRHPWWVHSEVVGGVHPLHVWPKLRSLNLPGCARPDPQLLAPVNQAIKGRASARLK
jgi:hypothetical protein